MTESLIKKLTEGNVELRLRTAKEVICCSDGVNRICREVEWI